MFSMALTDPYQVNVILLSIVIMGTFSLYIHDAVARSYGNAEVGVVKSQLGWKNDKSGQTGRRKLGGNH